MIPTWRRTVSRVLLALGVLLSVVLSLLLAPAVTPAASARGSDGLTSADQELADTYSPVVVLRRHDQVCSTDGEPYVPMSVDAVLGNPVVALRQVGNGDPVIRWAPTAKELYGLGPGTYLDLPGDALSPGCVYATDSAAYTPLDRSSVYAHVVTQPDRPGYLAVQYWLYWYFNDWNDRHESDWEFVQVLFKADTVQQALHTTPVSVGYAQHEGGETAAWTSSKLQKQGTHPLVYASQGSHASYFSAALYLGRSANEGFGCDNTQPPSTQVHPSVVLLPDRPSGPADPFAWLAYGGRWGERHSGPNNGPDGPAGKPRWTEPVTWQDHLRASSVEIPGGSSTPPAVVGTFCTVVGAGSVLLFHFLAHPGLMTVILALLVLALVFLLRRTSWSAVPAHPVASRRRAGQIVRASRRVYRRHPLTFALLGLLVIPVGVVSALVTAFATHVPFFGDLVGVSTDRGSDSANKLAIASWVGTALWPMTVLLVSAAAAHVLDSAGHTSYRWGHRAALDAVRTVWRRARELIVAFGPVLVLVIVLQLTVIGAPVALWVVVRNQFVAQVVTLEGLRGRAARRRSAALVRHRWWHTAMFAILIWSGIHLIGVVLGLLLLVIVTSMPLWGTTLIMTVVEIALTPLGAIALTLLYGDARVQKDQAPTAVEPAPIG